LTAVLAGPRVAAAALGGGAVIDGGSYDVDRCYDERGGGTKLVCVTSTRTWSSVLTPSGNYLYHETRTTTYSLTLDGETVQQRAITGTFQSAYTRNNEEFGASSLFADTWLGQTYCITSTSPFVHGRYQYDDVSFVC